MKIRPRYALLQWRVLPRSSAPGFTMLEILVVVVIVGILAAIAAPGWLGLLDRQQLNAGRDELHQAILQAQTQAKTKRVRWQASFRTHNGRVQWQVHAAGTTPAENRWQSLSDRVQLDSETTLQEVNGVRRLVFTDKGHINPPLGRLTLSSRQGGRTKRCVIASTLLGAVRKSEEQPTARDGRYCY